MIGKEIEALKKQVAAAAEGADDKGRVAVEAGLLHADLARLELLSDEAEKASREASRRWIEAADAYRKNMSDEEHEQAAREEKTDYVSRVHVDALLRIIDRLREGL